jgi:hypothetical protein
MVGVEFVTRLIAPLQDHRRSIWAHRAGDDIWLHASELNADAREEVIRAFFSSASIPSSAPSLMPNALADGHRHQPQPFRAREAGLNAMPREYTCDSSYF